MGCDGYVKARPYYFTVSLRCYVCRQTVSNPATHSQSCLNENGEIPVNIEFDPPEDWRER